MQSIKRMLSGLLLLCLFIGITPVSLAAESAAEFPSIGFENSNAPLNLIQIGRYISGMSNADGGVMEIITNNHVNGYAYAINGQAGLLTAIQLNALNETGYVQHLHGLDIDVKALVNAEGFSYGDMTSVAVSPNGQLLVAAIQAENYADAGRAAFFTCNTDGSLTFLTAIETGVQPDMITFTPDGSKILTANEGEPREGYAEGAVDPMGSVTIINTDTLKSITLDFSAFDSRRDSLIGKGLVLKKDTAPSVDLEPEYIAASNEAAYITLQEANAIAVLDLTSNHFTDIYSVGFEDHSTVAIDIDKKDKTYAPKTYEALLGIRMPDGIALVTIDGTDYLLTANEGDSREWGDYLNEDERNFGNGDTSPSGAITAENSGISGKVVFFDTTDYDGLNQDTDYLYGSRSFTMFKVDADGLQEVFDSADNFERLTAGYLPAYFNCSNDDLSIDDRSGKKGPEAESVTVGTVDGKTYAFVTLERIGGVMVYDISHPESISYVNYINSRDFSTDVGNDDSPEGLCFIPAEQSSTGKALLLAACEVGGTVAAYTLDSLPFTDVSADSWYRSAAAYVYENGLMQGNSNTTFAPEKNLTRAMAVQILYNMEDQPFVQASVFTDVPSNAWYENAIAWASATGIVTGYNASTFGPDDPITRQQLASILYRYAAYKGINVHAEADLSAYADATLIDSYAEAAMQWAVASGLLKGINADQLDPNGMALRSQTAALLMRFCENLN